jgi:hypothetical protein
LAELIGMYVGALALSGALTRLIRILLRLMDEPGKSLLSAILVGLLCLVVASYMMGPSVALPVYLPSVGAWLVFDLYRAAKVKLATGTSRSIPGIKRCPRCAEFVQPEAKICRFCHYEFLPANVGNTDSEASRPKPTPTPETDEPPKRCPRCGAPFSHRRTDGMSVWVCVRPGCGMEFPGRRR